MPRLWPSRLEGTGPNAMTELSFVVLCEWCNSVCVGQRGVCAAIGQAEVYILR